MQLQPSIRTLFPGYFALVMATGIVSLSAHFLGLNWIPIPLFYLNLLFYVSLWILTLARIIGYGSDFIKDLTDHARWFLDNCCRHLCSRNTVRNPHAKYFCRSHLMVCGNLALDFIDLYVFNRSYRARAKAFLGNRIKWNLAYHCRSNSIDRGTWHTGHSGI